MIATTAMKGRQAALFLQQHFPTDPAWSKQKIWKLCRNGVLPHVCVGQNFYLLPDQLLQWIRDGGGRFAHGWRRKPGPMPGPKPKRTRPAKRHPTRVRRTDSGGLNGRV